MTTRPRPPVPEPPTVRLRDPAGVVAAVPYLLGFEPRRSLVVVGVDRDEGVGPTLRVDLDVADASVEQVAATWAHVQTIMERNGCRSLLAALYTDVDPAEPAPGLEPATVGAVLAGPTPGTAGADGPTRPRVGLLDAIQVGPSRFRSLVCDDATCCPGPGSPRSLATSHPVAASFVLAGRSPVADRQHTAPEDTTVTSADAATARASAEAARAAAAGGTTTPPREARGTARTDQGPLEDERSLHRRWSAALPACPDPALAGLLVAGWRASTRLRDACLAHFLPGGDQVAAALLDPAGDRGGAALARALADPACAGAARRGDAVLRRLAALVTGADRATVQAAHAWLSWVSGDGTAAGVLAERSLTEDGGQPLAGLVGRCLEHGLGAPWTTAPPPGARGSR